MKNLIFSGLALLFLAGCGQVKRVDTSAIEEQRKINKIKHVTEKQLIEKFTEIGEYAEKEYGGEAELDCKTAYNFGKGRDIEVYNSNLIDSSLLQDDLRGGILEAIKYSFENDIKIGTNLQEINDTLYIYSFPLKEDSFLKSECENDFAIVLISKTQLINSL